MAKAYTDLSLLLLGDSSCTLTFGEMVGTVELAQSPLSGDGDWAFCVLSFPFGC